MATREMFLLEMKIKNPKYAL